MGCPSVLGASTHLTVGLLAFAGMASIATCAWDKTVHATFILQYIIVCHTLELHPAARPQVMGCPVPHWQTATWHNVGCALVHLRHMLKLPTWRCRPPMGGAGRHPVRPAPAVLRGHAGRAGCLSTPDIRQLPASPGVQALYSSRNPSPRV